jgi:hypothetical protein
MVVNTIHIRPIIRSEGAASLPLLLLRARYHPAISTVQSNPLSALTANGIKFIKYIDTTGPSNLL